MTHLSSAVQVKFGFLNLEASLQVTDKACSDCRKPNQTSCYITTLHNRYILSSFFNCFYQSDIKLLKKTKQELLSLSSEITYPWYPPQYPLGWSLRKRWGRKEREKWNRSLFVQLTCAKTSHFLPFHCVGTESAFRKVWADTTANYGNYDCFVKTHLPQIPSGNFYVVAK